MKKYFSFIFILIFLCTFEKVNLMNFVDFKEPLKIGQLLFNLGKKIEEQKNKESYKITIGNDKSELIFEKCIMHAGEQIRCANTCTILIVNKSNGLIFSYGDEYTKRVEKKICEFFLKKKEALGFKSLPRDVNKIWFLEGGKAIEFEISEDYF